MGNAAIDDPRLTSQYPNHWHAHVSVVFEEVGVKVDDVTFSDRVTGSFQHRSPQLTLSFFNNKNRAFKGYQARVHLTKTEDISDEQALKMVSTTCFDPEGNRLASSNVKVASK